LAVLRSGPLQDGIRSALVIVVCEIPAIAIADRKHRVERRAERTGVYFQGEVFALFRLEGEKVVVVLLTNDPVGGAGELRQAGRCLGVSVRLRLGPDREW